MIDVKKVLKGTKYEDKTQMVTNVLDRAGHHRFQELPRLGLTNVDVYDLLAVMNGRIAELAQAEKEKAVVAEVKKKSAVKKDTAENQKKEA